MAASFKDRASEDMSRAAGRHAGGVQPLTPAPANRGSIVVVDDDGCLRELRDIHLSNAGYSVQTAEDAVVGGRLILQQPPNLLITDVDMPFMNGYELAAALKSDPRTRGIPVVFLTSDDEVDQHAGSLGAVAYLRKPVSVDRLLEVVGLYMPFV